MLVNELHWVYQTPDFHASYITAYEPPKITCNLMNVCIQAKHDRIQVIDTWNINV